MVIEKQSEEERERGGEQCKDGEYLENIGNKTKKLKNIGRFYKYAENIYKRVATPVRDKAITIAKKREFSRPVNCFVFLWMGE